MDGLWPFVDPAWPILGCPGGLRHTWQQLLGSHHAGQLADGHFLLPELRTLRRRAGYPPELTPAYDAALAMPLRYAGPGQ